MESWFECASGGNNGIVLEVHIAFNPLANMPVWMGQGKVSLFSSTVMEIECLAQKTV